jgi:hypothetical protein
LGVAPCGIRIGLDPSKSIRKVALQLHGVNATGNNHCVPVAYDKAAGDMLTGTSESPQSSTR